MFYINVWLTVNRAEDVDRVRDLLAEMGVGVRDEPGAARFEVYQSATAPDRFLLNEHWYNQADWEVHREGRICKEIYEPLILPLVTREPHICQLVG
jgi:quinol monooxygenase YgiN